MLHHDGQASCVSRTDDQPSSDKLRQAPTSSDSRLSIEDWLKSPEANRFASSNQAKQVSLSAASDFASLNNKISSFDR